MSLIVKPLVSPVGRVILLSCATVWLVAAVAMSSGGDATAGDRPAGEGAHLATLSPPDLRVEAPAGVDGPLYKSRGLSITPDGSILVADSGNGRVLALDGEDPGLAIRSFGLGIGEGPGELQSPASAVADAAGNVFVADKEIGRITKYGPDSSYIDSVSMPAVSSLMLTSTGELLAWPGRDGMLNRFSNDLEPLGSALESPDPTRHKLFSDIMFALDRNDRLYWINQESLVVNVHDVRDDFRQVGSWPIEVPGLREDVARREERLLAEYGPGYRVNPIMQFTISPAGDRLVMTYSHKGHGGYTEVYVFTPDGQLEQAIEGVGHAYAAIVDGAGRLVVADGEALYRWDVAAALSPRLTASTDDD